MDENYLDSLLNEISLDNEIDLDMQNEAGNQANQTELKEEVFNNLVNQDSDTKMAADDDIFGESQLDELDQLDQMADLDMSELDFSDLDFDDLDMLNTSPQTESQIKKSAPNVNAQEEMPEMNLDTLSIDDMFFEQPQSDAGAEVLNTEQEAQDTEDFLSNIAAGDSLNQLQEDDQQQSAQEDSGAESMTGTEFFEGNDDSGEINELLEMLGMEEDELPEKETASAPNDADVQEGKEEGMSSLDSDMNRFMDDSPSDEVVEAKPRRTLAQILFGSDDDDELELSEEELEAIKAEKKAKKDAKKADKKAKDDEKRATKAAKDAAVQANKAAKKAVKDAERKAMLDAAPPDIKLNPTLVASVMLFFALVGAVIIIGTNVTNYKIVVHKATDYFNRQKYHLAYDEIVGVEVKDKDKELESKIYTVMYVEQLYEAYEINVKLRRMDKALDSLLRGLVKYDQHYEDAVELNVVNDINSSRSKIIDALLSVYGLSEEDAYAILELDSTAYRARLADYAVDTDDDSMISLDPTAYGEEVAQ